MLNNGRFAPKFDDRYGTLRPQVSSRPKAMRRIGSLDARSADRITSSKYSSHFNKDSLLIDQNIESILDPQGHKEGVSNVSDPNKFDTLKSTQQAMKLLNTPKHINSLKNLNSPSYGKAGDKFTGKNGRMLEGRSNSVQIPQF